MRINTKTVLLIETGAEISREAYEYNGPVTQAISFGGNKSQSKSKSESKSESGTEFNEDFLNKAFAYASLAKPGKYKVQTGGAGPEGTRTPEQERNDFDAERYLAENPDVAGFKDSPYEHYIRHGKAEGRKYPGDSGIPGFAGSENGELEFEIPGYDPTFVRSNYTGANYTGANYTPVHGGDFDALEKNLFDTQGAKINKAYADQVARQREELSQSGALNSPSQFLEGSARSSLDRSYLDNLQQVARDVSTQVLGLKRDEAARRTGFDVGEATRRTGFDTGEAARRTGFDTGEAARETGFNEETAARLLQLWLQKIGIIGEVGRYARGESVGSSSGSSMGGNFGFLGLGTAR